ncbi:hypothetical protein CARUB_v10005425mg [Capsella rubella]|uniref:Uncharacterized protein n=1 Tax=Capsella rubella TaxID=81985 RepID=R0F5T7_9BRAS|nr:UPF0725 protein At3g57210 [Capsella rubella]EOA17157.1 hypothetical protein CARUB_v10005425mg [Capsella rubella]
MSQRIESNEALDSNNARSKRLQRFKKCKGFDTTVTGNGHQLVNFICNDRWSPCNGLVRLYARMGLHRYNFLQGKNLQFSHVKKYNMTTAAAACSYYITLVAKDLDSSKLLYFQTRVNEESFCKLILSCDIARPRGTNTEYGAITEHYCYLKSSVPKCPPEDIFENRNRFYLVKESELEENDWIRLYLELAVATTHTNTGRDHDLSNLKILKVAIETPEDLEPPNEGSLSAITALVYIRYEDSCESRVGKDVDRIAYVKRTFSKHHGSFVLEGRNKPIKSEVVHGT